MQDKLRTYYIRELNLTRDAYEDTTASEENRIAVNAVKSVLRVLFDDELERIDE